MKDFVCDGAWILDKPTISMANGGSPHHILGEQVLYEWKLSGFHFVDRYIKV